MTQAMAEVTGLEGSLPSGKIAIIASRYNASICDSMVAAALETLVNAGYDEKSIVVVRVPGAWELPWMTQTMLDQGNHIAMVTLGCVIKGETTHDEHINRAVSLSLMEMGVKSRVPIAFGLLTCNTLEQAIQRSGGNVGNKGHESAEAVLELLRLQAKIA